jgi:hypothetical protein
VRGEPGALVVGEGLDGGVHNRAMLAAGSGGTGALASATELHTLPTDLIDLCIVRQLDGQSGL